MGRAYTIAPDNFGGARRFSAQIRDTRHGGVHHVGSGKTLQEAYTLLAVAYSRRRTQRASDKRMTAAMQRADLSGRPVFQRQGAAYAAEWERDQARAARSAVLAARLAARRRFATTNPRQRNPVDAGTLDAMRGHVRAGEAAAARGDRAGALAGLRAAREIGDTLWYTPENAAARKGRIGWWDVERADPTLGEAMRLDRQARDIRYNPAKRAFRKGDHVVTPAGGVGIVQSFEMHDRVFNTDWYIVITADGRESWPASGMRKAKAPKRRNSAAVAPAALPTPTRPFRGRYVLPEEDEMLPAVTYTSEVYAIGGILYADVQKQEPGYPLVEVFEGRVPDLRGVLYYDGRIRKHQLAPLLRALLGAYAPKRKKA